MRNIAFRYVLLMLSMLIVDPEQVKGDAVEVIELASHWSISNQNGCKYERGREEDRKLNVFEYIH